MKRSVYTIGSLIIILIAAGIFVLVPIFSAGMGHKRLPAFGKYDGTEIRYEQGTDFANYVANIAENFKNSGREINDSNYDYIFEYAFNAAVSKLAAKKAVAKSGYTVPAAAVNRAMRPYFTDESGNYSQRVYKQADPQRVADMRKNFEDTLFTDRYKSDLFGSSETMGKTPLYGLKSSESEINFIRKMNDKQRAFNSVAFNMNDYPDSEKVAYGKENIKKFVKYDISIINCDDKAKASSLLKRLSNSEITFADAVGEYSKKSYSDETGKLRSNYGYQIERIIDDTADIEKVTGLAVDTTSEVIKTSIGYSIFHADGEPVQPDFDDEDIVKTVYNYLTSYEFSRVEDYYVNLAKDFAKEAEASGFDSACRKYSLKNNAVESFPLNYGNLAVLDKLDTGIQGLYTASNNENFFKTAFAMEMNAVSEPIVLNRNVVVLQYISDAHGDSEEIPPEAVSDELSNYDSSSSQTALLSSPKLENNLHEVYFKYIKGN